MRILGVEEWKAAIAMHQHDGKNRNNEREFTDQKASLVLVLDDVRLTPRRISEHCNSWNTEQLLTLSYSH